MLSKTGDKTHHQDQPMTPVSFNVSSTIGEESQIINATAIGRRLAAVAILPR